MISLWDTAPEELADRGTKYTNRAIQAIQDPTGRENAKNIYFGLIMGVSAALPTFLHLGLFISSALRCFNFGKKEKPGKDNAAGEKGDPQN